VGSLLTTQQHSSKHHAWRIQPLFPTVAVIVVFSTAGGALWERQCDAIFCTGDDG